MIINTEYYIEKVESQVIFNDTDNSKICRSLLLSLLHKWLKEQEMEIRNNISINVGEIESSISTYTNNEVYIDSSVRICIIISKQNIEETIIPETNKIKEIIFNLFKNICNKLNLNDIEYIFITQNGNCIGNYLLNTSSSSS